MSLVSLPSVAKKSDFDFNRLADWSIFYFTDHLEVKSPPFHGDIYDSIQTGDSRIAIMSFRGSAKSSCVRCYILECIYEGRRVAKRVGLLSSYVKKVVYVSSTEDVAVETLDWIKEQIESNMDLQADYQGFTILKWN